MEKQQSAANLVVLSDSQNLMAKGPLLHRYYTCRVAELVSFKDSISPPYLSESSCRTPVLARPLISRAASCVTPRTPQPVALRCVSLEFPERQIGIAELYGL